MNNCIDVNMIKVNMELAILLPFRASKWMFRLAMGIG